MTQVTAPSRLAAYFGSLPPPQRGKAKKGPRPWTVVACHSPFEWVASVLSMKKERSGSYLSRNVLAWNGLLVKANNAVVTMTVGNAPSVLHELSLSRHLATIQDVDAVFVSTEDDVVHVYSIVREFDDGAYEKLLKKEEEIQQACPEIVFEFHVRAHQGRVPSEAAPLESQPVFIR
jgi:hypothetical protein